MALSILPTADDSRTNATFDELMWALARPGLVRILPLAGFETLAESLIDRECSFHAGSDSVLAKRLAETGARPVSLDKADYVFTTLGSERDVAAVSTLRIGTLAYPDEAATLFAPARIGSGQALRLSGPGIKDILTIEIGGVDPSFWPMREKAIRYPLGWDLYLVDGDRLIGIPRSTKIEVL
ncbi:phosphonate C-P lyase system protein PhnH [Xaviernesmea oryzae]|uniref:Alpha-D-ribose 1-methylphosphonate 5-triphosphate synthase subunit PhnH n=1 Tax=Xaviernesmea oryzae TaxID=464029 RepID=A0A1X7EJY5_9HYPH|nr:phosphonate C-P lyase system protein PhnH [Xaviernesmea oryzae]SMF35188.1 alpha-D-ribose 1-methylphosphonate 5-triphosphate synthase subunit PhnH [Xaviernesmea oryzae]